MKCLRSASAILICLLVTAPVLGQTSRPASVSTAGALDRVTEDDPLQPAGGTGSASSASGLSTTASGIGELSRIAIALLIVIGLILILRAVVRNLAAMPGTNRSGKLVTVLSRSVVSPRQQVLVLQFGKRLILVGDSGGRMSALCEVSDPDEVAAIIGKTRAEQQTPIDRGQNVFSNLFRRANEPFAESDPVPEAMDDPVKNVEAVDPISAEEMGGLLEKIRTLQQQFRQT